MKKFIKPTYVAQLTPEEQDRVRRRLIKAGLRGEALEDAMNSKLVDVDYDKDPEIVEIDECDDVMSSTDTDPVETALGTLHQIQELYENDESGLLYGEMYTDFMKEVDSQIQDIELIRNRRDGR